MVKNTIQKNQPTATHYTPRRSKPHARISVCISQTEHEALRQIAQKNNRSLSNQARLLLVQNIVAQTDNVNISSDY